MGSPLSSLSNGCVSIDSASLKRWLYDQCPSHISIVSPHVLHVCLNCPVAKKFSTAVLQSGHSMVFLLVYPTTRPLPPSVGTCTHVTSHFEQVMAFPIGGVDAAA